jgi:hypothetical protein
MPFGVPAPCRKSGSARAASTASGDCNDLGVRFPGSYAIANLLTHQSPCHWRDIRDRTARGIGFVLANDPVGLPAPIIPPDGHATTELDLRRIGWRSNYLGRRSAGGPIPHFAREPGQGRAIARCLRNRMFLLQASQRGFDGRQASGRHDIWMWGSRPVWEFVEDLVRLFDESPAHECALALEITGNIPQGTPPRNR